jgi:hypothetical protein
VYCLDISRFRFSQTFLLLIFHSGH